MEPSSPAPQESGAPPEPAKGLPAAVWVVGVIAILGLFMWIFRS